MPSRFATCTPRSSTSAAGTVITETLSAIAIITSKSASRLDSGTSFESRTAPSSGAKGSFRMTAAITKGPAHGPRPASSTPAMGEIPALRRSSSIAFMRVKSYLRGSCDGTVPTFLIGQIIPKTRPVTLDSGTKPLFTSSWW